MFPMNRIFAFTALLALPVFAQETIEVFTELPVQIDALSGVEVIHYDLSEPDRIKSKLNLKLPPDEEIAKAKAKQFFQTPEGKAYQVAMRDAYRGRQKMMQYQLSKIPAIVFDDGKYVIYGTTDVAHSARLYRQHIQNKQE
jgi:integrating conjugative element protein (TIGR03757 family)